MSPQNTSQAEAVRILQDVLDAVSDAIVSGDLKTVRDRVKLPFVRRTLKSEVIIETEEDLDRGTLGTAQALVSKGVNQFIRLASDAEFLSPNYILGHHVSHLLRNAKRVFPSYANRTVLCKDGGAWKISEIDSALENSEWPFKRFEVPDVDPDVIRLPVGTQDMRRTQAEPLVIYQTFLDRLTAANTARDLDAYGKMVSLPYTVHHEHSDMVIATTDGMRPVFETISQLLDKVQADRFERTAEKAEFISGTMICGYHTSWMYRDGDVVLGPIRSRMILERTGPTWLLKSVTNAVANKSYPYSDPITQHALVTIREIQERQRQ